MTLPNILKEFNPNVGGYSIGQGEFLAPNSHMNVAFPVSADADALRQAQHLIKKMKREPGVDFKHDWKVKPHPHGRFYFKSVGQRELLLLWHLWQSRLEIGKGKRRMVTANLGFIFISKPVT